MEANTSLDEIVKRFGLSVDHVDHESVVQALRLRLVELHPDRNGGDFETADSKRVFLEIKDAIKSIEAGRSEALIPLRDVQKFMESLAKSLGPVGGVNERMLHAQQAREIHNGVKLYHRPFRLTSGVFAGICSGLVFFMGSFKENPLFGPLLQMRGVQLSLAALWFYSGVFFLFAWLGERRAESYADCLNTDEGLSITFKKLMAGGVSRLPNGVMVFSRRNLVEAILGRPRGLSFLPIGSGALGRSAAEGIASLQLSKLQARGVIKLHPTKDLVDWFEVDPNIP